MYHVGVDVGGTFTDLFAVRAETGEIVTAKAITTRDGVSGVVDAIRKSSIKPEEIETLIFGSTRATNALVQGEVAKVAFFATAGFGDTLEIRRLWREHLFGWRWERPEALVAGNLRFGIPGRLDWQGKEVESIDIAALDAAIRAAQQQGAQAIAVSLLFSFLNPSHENVVRDRIHELAPGMSVVLSSDINPEIGDYERGSTTVIAASISSLVDEMLNNLDSSLSDTGISAAPQVIKSNGGVMSTTSARAKPLELVRSGPAGGVASVARLSAETGLPNLIGVDIGGTTADVCVVSNGSVAYTNMDYVQWDIPLRANMADVRSVGSGGGSIAHLDAAKRLHVGPQSSGAEPGPASYGRGGTDPTTTDAALVAGFIDPDQFLGGEMSLDLRSAREAIEARVAKPLSLTIEEAAGGIFKLATARMAQLINEMTVQVGLDPRDYVVVGFGGAGPMFAATLAHEIEAAYAMVPRFPSVWSAYGGLFADIVHDYAQTLFDDVEKVSLAKVNEVASTLMEAARVDLERDGASPDETNWYYSFDLRYAGQSHQLSVATDQLPPYSRAHLCDVKKRFEDLHQATYAHRRPEDACELTTVRLQARVPRRLRSPSLDASRNPETVMPSSQREVHFHGFSQALNTSVYDRGDLPTSFGATGPALIEEAQATTVVPPGCRFSVDAAGNIIIEGQAS